MSPPPCSFCDSTAVRFEPHGEHRVDVLCQQCGVLRAKIPVPPQAVPA